MVFIFSLGLTPRSMAQRDVNPLPFAVSQLSQDLENLRDLINLLSKLNTKYDKAKLNKDELVVLNLLSNKELSKNLRLNSDSEKFKSKQKIANKLLKDTIRQLKSSPLTTIYSGELEKNMDEVRFLVEEMMKIYPGKLKKLLKLYGFDEPSKIERLQPNKTAQDSPGWHLANYKTHRSERRKIFVKSFVQPLLEVTATALSLLYATGYNEVLSGAIGSITVYVVYRNLLRITNGFKKFRSFPKNNSPGIYQAMTTAEKDRVSINAHIAHINASIRENITKSCKASAKRMNE